MKTSLAISSLSIFSLYSASNKLVVGSVIGNQDLRAAARQRFTHSHTLGKDYVFDPRDGWTTLNATDMAYKYSLDSSSPASEYKTRDYGSRYDTSDVSAYTRATTKSYKKKKKPSHKKVQASVSSSLAQNLGGVVGDAVEAVAKLLHGYGKAEPVTITWYTGNDLANPSCWSDSVWAPTDASFAAALTLEGWTSKPQCFKFLELCHTSSSCIFVRVVDTCAGCAKGSKHVDLTRAAFGALANFDLGILTVQMRPATEPEEHWFNDLWGPKAS